MKADQDEKLFEPCKGEFLSFPRACVQGGQPKAAKRRGAGGTMSQAHV
jgi:hypothetical protein